LIKFGLHDPSSRRVKDHFTENCCRDWFTTHLRRAGMPRDFIKELRGDKRRDDMDVYYHIDKEELRKSYLSCIPQLGI
jgi:integrase/recombinase XerD